MSHGKEPVRNKPLDVVRQLQKPHCIRDRGAVLADLFAEVLLRILKLLYQKLVCLTFLYRIEIFPLDILDKGYLQLLVVGDIANNGGNLLKARQFGRSPSPLPCHDFISVNSLP